MARQVARRTTSSSHGDPAELDEYMETHPSRSDRGTLVGRTVLEGSLFKSRTFWPIPNTSFKDAALSVIIGRRSASHSYARGCPLACSA